MITRKTVAEKLTAYMNHRCTLAELVAWAEDAMIHGGLDDERPGELMDILGRLAAADAQGFGLLWTDFDLIFQELGYSLEIISRQAA